MHIAILKEYEELVEHFVQICPEALKIGDNVSNIKQSTFKDSLMIINLFQKSSWNVHPFTMPWAPVWSKLWVEYWYRMEPNVPIRIWKDVNRVIILWIKPISCVCKRRKMKVDKSGIYTLTLSHTIYPYSLITYCTRYSIIWMDLLQIVPPHPSNHNIVA